MDDIRFYAVHVSASGRVALRWSKPLPTPAEARDRAREEIAAGNASIAFVVRAAGDAREVLVTYTQPPSARKIVSHYERLLEAIDAYEE